EARIDVALGVAGEFRSRVRGALVHEARRQEDRLVVLAVRRALETVAHRARLEGPARDGAAFAFAVIVAAIVAFVVGTTAHRAHSCVAGKCRLIWLRGRSSSNGPTPASRSRSMRSRYSGVMSPVT